jgi:hypothetical protein
LEIFSPRTTLKRSDKGISRPQNKKKLAAI